MPRDESELTPRPVEIVAGDTSLTGDLTLPRGATGIELFAPSKSGSRLSRRNRFVATQLARAGLATLLLELLTPAEEEEELRKGELRPDIPFLAYRLMLATQFVIGHSDTHRLAIGYFGASTGAAAALIAAALLPERIRAVVSRAGRPDLADDWLDRVAAPTLLLVGGAEHFAVDLNTAACARLGCPRRVEVIPGATSLFDEPGALEEVARASREWFVRYLMEERAARALLEPKVETQQQRRQSAP